MVVFLRESSHTPRRQWFRVRDRVDYALPFVSAKDPRVPTKGKKEWPGLNGVPLPGVWQCRELADALTARALLHTCEGHTEQAWQDLLACHRLARLVARGPTLIESLVALSNS